MGEAQPKYSNPDKKIMSPIERINHGVFEISKAMELTDEQYEALRRYATIAFRINEITFDFNLDYVTEKSYPLESGEGDFTLTRGNYRQFRDRLKARIVN